MQQRPGNEIGVENFVNPFEMTGNQFEAGNHYILRSLPSKVSWHMPLRDLAHHRKFSRLLGEGSCHAQMS